MKINIVCHEETSSWILGKFALKLKEELLHFEGVECELSSRALDGFDVVHHIIYSADFEAGNRLTSCMVTHVDGAKKIDRIRELTDSGVHCICMSNDTMSAMLHFGFSSLHLHCILPAHDFDAERRKINLLITSRIYPDDRKNQHLLKSLLSPERAPNFKLIIMGSGWEPILKQLPDVEVEYYSVFDKNIYQGLFARADYFLYLGFDEGSMGYLDALHAGLRPIVSLQGFHKDLRSDQAFYFRDPSELTALFERLSAEMAEMRGLVADLSWKRYANAHHQLWTTLGERGTNAITPHPRRNGRQRLSLFAKKFELYRKEMFSRLKGAGR